MEIAVDQATRGLSGRARAVIGAVAGHMVEWFDFTVYAFMASTLGRHFFPSSDPAVSLLATFAVFGVGFVVRPIGGIVIGRLGDIFGRRFTLILSMAMMTGGTAAAGLLPDYESIGLAAPLLLLLARLTQGFAVGGEWGNSAAFLVEWAPEGRRGLYGSLQSCSTTVGTLSGSALVALMTSTLGTAAMESWGWRLPFLFAGVLGIVIAFMRRTMAEPPAFQRAAEAPACPEAGASQGVRVLQAVGVILPLTVGTYIFLTYMPTFATAHVRLPAADALWSNTLSAVVSASMIPVFGAMSDRIGRRPQLLAACVLFIVLPYPLFSLLLSGVSFGTVLAVQVALNLSLALVGSVAASTLSELFETRSRTTWMTSVYALTVSVFGGFAPFIATWLIHRTGQPIAPVVYVIGAGLVSLPIIWTMKETAFRRLS